MGRIESDWGTDYYTHPDEVVAEEWGYGRPAPSSPFDWVYWQHGMREELSMDRRSTITAVLGILAAAITICTVAFFIYDNSIDNHESDIQKCQQVIDAEESEAIVTITCSEKGI